MVVLAPMPPDKKALFFSPGFRYHSSNPTGSMAFRRRPIHVAQKGHVYEKTQDQKPSFGPGGGHGAESEPPGCAGICGQCRVLYHPGSLPHGDAPAEPAELHLPGRRGPAGNFGEGHSLGPHALHHPAPHGDVCQQLQNPGLRVGSGSAVGRQPWDFRHAHRSQPNLQRSGGPGLCLYPAAQPGVHLPVPPGAAPDPGPSRVWPSCPRATTLLCCSC